MTIGRRVWTALLELACGFALSGAALGAALLLGRPSIVFATCGVVVPFAAVLGIGLVNHLRSDTVSLAGVWNLIVAYLLGMVSAITIQVAMEHHPELLAAAWVSPVVVAWAVWNVGIARQKRSDEF